MKIIWINGCFDILHRGHIELFEYAKSLGHFLIVGIDTDDRIKENKGSSRPFNSVDDRKKVLESIKHINTVVTFNSDKQLKTWIKAYKPDIMIVGSDWKGKKIIGSEFAGKVEFFNRVGDYSTTKILEAK